MFPYLLGYFYHGIFQLSFLVPPVREVSEPELSAVRKLIAEEESPRRPDADRFSDSDKVSWSSCSF